MTEDIVEIIDHTLTDYDVSNDAMRWTPDEVPDDPPSPHSALYRAFRHAYETGAISLNPGDVIVTQLLTVDGFRDAMERAMVATCELVEAAGPLLDAVEERVRWADVYGISGPDPVDPRYTRVHITMTDPRDGRSSYVRSRLDASIPGEYSLFLDRMVRELEQSL